MRVRRLLTVVVATALAAAAFGLTSSPPAHAEATCTTTLHVPARVVVASPKPAFTYSITSTCPSPYAYNWDPLNGADDENDGLSARCDPATHQLYDKHYPNLTDTSPLGEWLWRGLDVTSCDDTSAENSPTSYVRVGTVAYLSVTRTGPSVTLSPHAARYWTSAHEWRYYPYAVGQLQYQDPGGAWTALKSFTSDTYGHSSYTYSPPRPRDYRVVYPQTTYIWGDYSDVVHS